MARDLFKGVVLGAAVSTVFMMAGAALAGTGVGAVFNLGKTNRVNAQSTLKGATAATARTLQVTNTGSGSGLGITVSPGKSPIVVNSAAGKARNLDADRLDGLDSSQLQFIQLPLTAVALSNGATLATGYGDNAGIRLPDSGLPHLDVGFTVPPSYTPGDTLMLRVVWHVPATTGAVVLAPNYLSATRPGRTAIVDSSVTSGLTAVGGNVLTVPSTANQSAEKLYEITSPRPDTPLQPGDAIVLGLYRSAGNAADTCTADLCITSLSISY